MTSSSLAPSLSPRATFLCTRLRWPDVLHAHLTFDSNVEQQQEQHPSSRMFRLLHTGNLMVLSCCCFPHAAFLLLLLLSAPRSPPLFPPQSPVAAPLQPPVTSNEALCHTNTIFPIPSCRWASNVSHWERITSHDWGFSPSAPTLQLQLAAHKMAEQALTPAAPPCSAGNTFYPKYKAHLYF